MTITLPDPEELYDSPVGHRTTGLTRRQFFKKAAMSIGAVVIAASSLSLFNACAPPSSQPPVIQPATISPEKSYRDRVREALLQDVPELANYKSALDYTTQRVVDMKNVYKLDLDQVRSPVAKWAQANIDWDKKGERLVPFSEEIDYIPDALPWGNFNLGAEDKDYTNKPLAALTDHVDEMVSQHDHIWAELHDSKKMEEFMEIAYWDRSINWTVEEAEKYKSAIRNYGTDSDKAHWALIGRAASKTKYNEEITRNEMPLAMILAVGGKAQIAHNVTVNHLNVPRGDRQLAIGISSHLEDHFRNEPETYGHPIDSGYLQPNLPNVEALKSIEIKSNGKGKWALVYRQGNVHRPGENNPNWLVGNADIAKKIGWTSYYRSLN